LIRSAADPDCVSGLDPPARSLQRGPQVPGPGGAAFCRGRAVWRGIVAAPCRRSVGPRFTRLKKQKRKHRERDHEGDICKTPATSNSPRRANPKSSDEPWRGLCKSRPTRELSPFEGLSSSAAYRTFRGGYVARLVSAPFPLQQIERRPRGRGARTGSVDAGAVAHLARGAHRLRAAPRCHARALLPRSVATAAASR